jgi:hypothetical protein
MASNSKMEQGKARKAFMRSQGLSPLNRRKMNEALRDWDTNHPKPVVREEYHPSTQRSSSGGSNAGIRTSGFPYTGLLRDKPKATDENKFLGYTEEQVIDARNEVLKRYCDYSHRLSGCGGGAASICIIHPKYCNGYKGLPLGTWKNNSLIEGLKLNCYLR